MDMIRKFMDKVLDQQAQEEEARLREIDRKFEEAEKEKQDYAFSVTDLIAA